MDTVSRYCRNLRAEAEEVRRYGQAVSAVLGQAEDWWPGCDLAVLARKALLVRALNAIHQLPDDAFEAHSLDRLSLTVSRLERSGVMADGLRLAARRLEAEHPEPEPPGAVYRRKLEEMAAVEAISQEFVAKERARKRALRERPETPPPAPGGGEPPVS